MDTMKESAPRIACNARVAPAGRKTIMSPSANSLRAVPLIGSPRRFARHKADLEHCVFPDLRRRPAYHGHPLTLPFLTDRPQKLPAVVTPMVSIDSRLAQGWSSAFDGTRNSTNHVGTAINSQIRPFGFRTHCRSLRSGCGRPRADRQLIIWRLWS